MEISVYKNLKAGDDFVILDDRDGCLLFDIVTSGGKLRASHIIEDSEFRDVFLNRPAVFIFLQKQ